MTHALSKPFARPARHILALSILLAACAGGGKDAGPTTPPPVQPVATSLAISAGDGQTARVGTNVATPPSVVVRDQQGAAMAGVAVSFAVVSGGGTLTGSTASTDASGLAIAGAWTLGRTPGPNTLRAQAVGGANPSVTVNATARPPRWTFMVYMAADNTLTVPGLINLDQMDAAGMNPEVQVVMQAEFSPQQFANYGVPAAAANIPSNFNTFRYFISTGGNLRLGPETAVTDIGNRDMTSPVTLRDFVNYSKATYPAERYALVLWNHGGGFTGLIEDETSNPGHFMSLDDMASALTGVGALDLVAFDMCLMAGYETLAKLQGITKYALFSEAEVPGAGFPYTDALRVLYQNSTADSRAITSQLVEVLHSSYTGSRSSTTFSAYDMSGFAGFEQSLNAVAATLTANVGSLATSVGASVSRSQKFEFAFLTDVGDFADSLSVRASDATLRAQLSSLKGQVTGSAFRIASRARTGAGTNALSVARATGLSILLPSGLVSDAIPSTGPGSLAAYQSLMPSRAWTQFLSAWIPRSAALGYRDLGTQRLELYAVWDTTSQRRGAGVSLWVLEPNGNLYIPWLGTVTPNGLLTADSYLTKTFYEGYFVNRYVQTGRYRFYANLWADPNNARPFLDIQSRTSSTAALTSLYAPNYPRLSLQTSWLLDPIASFTRIEAGAYTDLRYMAFWDVTGSAVTALAIVAGDAARGMSATFSLRPGDSEPTKMQLSTVRRFMESGPRLAPMNARNSFVPTKLGIKPPEVRP